MWGLLPAAVHYVYQQGSRAADWSESPVVAVDGDQDQSTARRGSATLDLETRFRRPSLAACYSGRSGRESTTFIVSTETFVTGLIRSTM